MRRPTPYARSRRGPESEARSPEPDGESPKAASPEARERAAYVQALSMLARRELSEKQVRTRLARKGHADDDVDAAVVRLKAERALDDSRVAEAIARTETAIKRRGRLRVKRQIEQAGIAPALARQALDAVFEGVDDEALLEAALGRRLRGDRPIADDREFQRLYRYLVGQGFESDRVLRALNGRRAGRRRLDPDEPDPAE